MSDQPQNQPARRPRLVVVESVYHQEPDGSPTAVASRWNRWLVSDEQPYARRLKLTEAWQPLDTGWLDAASLLLLANATDPAVAPDAVVEVGVSLGHAGAPEAVGAVPCWLVRPGESLRAEPADLAELRLRCRQGTATVSITLFPA